MWNPLNISRLAVYVYEGCGVTARHGRQFEDQQTYDLIVQHHDFCTYYFIIITDILDILEEECEGVVTLSSHMTVKKVYESVSDQVVMIIHHLEVPLRPTEEI
jgi:hypothetical protein